MEDKLIHPYLHNNNKYNNNKVKIKMQQFLLNIIK